MVLATLVFVCRRVGAIVGDGMCATCSLGAKRTAKKRKAFGKLGWGISGVTFAVLIGRCGFCEAEERKIV